MAFSRAPLGSCALGLLTSVVISGQLCPLATKSVMENVQTAGGTRLL
jgi:hypothetical protein